jgi:hypothetical protein
LWKRPALAYSDLPPIALNELGGAADPSHRLIKRIEISRDLADLIVFMVNSYIRPTDIRNMQHKHIEIIKRNNMQYLRMTLPPSKGHSFPIVTMPWAVRVYERIYERHKRELGHDPVLTQRFLHRSSC